VTAEPRATLDADDRARLLRAADDRPLNERLLVYLVVGDGLTFAEAVGLRGVDLFDAAATVTTKTGIREARTLSSPAAELARCAAQGTAGEAALLATRSGRPLSIHAAREILLRLAGRSGVSVDSVHQLRADRWAVTPA
jgi:site-specific recombinase XerC